MTITVFQPSFGVLAWLLWLVNACNDTTVREQSELPPGATIWPSLGGALNLTDPTDNPWLREIGVAGESSRQLSAGPVGSSKDPGNAPSEEERTTDLTEEVPLTEDANKAPDVPPKLVLSTYLEGEGTRKLLELRNHGAQWSGNCELLIYSNGGTEPWRKVPLALSLSEGQTWTLCSDTAAAEAQLWGVDCDGALSGSLYNGNDALVVECDSAVVDSFGQVGFDPGKGWQSKRDPEVSTMDVRLLRCDESTDTEPSDEFELDSGWAVWPLGEEKQAALMRCLEMQSPGQGGAGSDF